VRSALPMYNVHQCTMYGYPATTQDAYIASLGPPCHNTPHTWALGTLGSAAHTELPHPAGSRTLLDGHAWVRAPVPRSTGAALGNGAAPRGVQPWRADCPVGVRLPGRAVPTRHSEARRTGSAAHALGVRARGAWRARYRPSALHVLAGRTGVTALCNGPGPTKAPWGGCVAGPAAGHAAQPQRPAKRTDGTRRAACMHVSGVVAIGPQGTEVAAGVNGAGRAVPSWPRHAGTLAPLGGGTLEGAEASRRARHATCGVCVAVPARGAEPTARVGGQRSDTSNLTEGARSARLAWPVARRQRINGVHAGRAEGVEVDGDGGVVG
jgi:hypothetical protein